MLVVGAMLARRNLRLGRGDRRGASRLAAFVFVAWAVAVFFGAHHVPNFDELALFLESLAWGLFLSCFVWVLYIALEPYVRRRWPATLVSWSRLLAGGFRDPLVGRDVLAGCLLGTFVDALRNWRGLFSPGSAILRRNHARAQQWQFLGARAIIADISNGLNISLFSGLRFCLSCFFSGPCCARSGRQRSHGFFSLRSFLTHRSFHGGPV